MIFEWQITFKDNEYYHYSHSYNNWGSAGKDIVKVFLAPTAADALLMAKVNVVDQHECRRANNKWGPKYTIKEIVIKDVE